MNAPSDYRRAVEDYIRSQALPVDKLGHMARLYTLTLQIGRGLDYDDDVVHGAAWMHDLGVFTGHRPEDPVALARWDCVGYAMRETPALLERLGFPKSKIPAVVEAIRTHQPAAEPLTLESEIVRDADILEQLGAIGVMRSACKVGRDTRYATFADILPVMENAATRLLGQLRLPVSRELGQARQQLMRQFLDALQTDAAGQPL